jgi:type II secretory pathway pseudopilin PulG
MKKLSQKGFGIVEVLLLVVLVGIIAGAGWYVYQSQKKTNASLDKTNQNIESISKSQKTVVDSTKSKDNTKYLVIKEWGVEIPLSADIEDATYTYKQIGDGSTAYLSTAKLTAMDPNCGPDKTSVGAIFRQTTAQHDENVKKDNPAVDVVGDVKVGNYYYGYNQAQAACSGTIDTAASKEQAKEMSLFRTAASNIKTVQ